MVAEMRLQCEKGARMPDNSDIKSAKPKKRPLIVSGNATNVLQENRDEMVLLSGGNPQIAKGYGNQPVQDYIAAMPEWKSTIGQKIDDLIVKAIPNVEKAVKWNSPLYGMQRGDWFLGFHCLTKYVKIAFFRGSQLMPEPPGSSKQKDVRYLDVYENRPLDEEQFIEWVLQASQLPGEKM